MKEYVEMLEKIDEVAPKLNGYLHGELLDVIEVYASAMMERARERILDEMFND